MDLFTRATQLLVAIMVLGSCASSNPDQSGGAVDRNGAASASAPGQDYSLMRAAGLIGMSPQTLVVCGCTEDDLESLLKTLRDSTSLRSELVASELAMQETGTRISSLNAKISVDRASLALRRSHNKETEKMKLIELHNAQVIAELRKAVQASLTPDQRSTWARVHENARLRIPLEYFALDDPSTDLKRLASAIKAEGRALRKNEPVPAEVASPLESARADPRVQAAKQRLADQLPSMQKAFIAALSPA